ncbi:MAG: MFS transporter [Bacteroidales bacterium]|nr:MFS transporter [Bacteroidales bacterium]
MKNTKFQFTKVADISAAHLLHDIYSSFLAPLTPILIEKLSLNFFLIGLLTVIQRSASLLNPLIGIIVDKKELRYFIILTPAVTAISMSMIGLVTTFWQLAGLLMIMGISSAFFHVPGPVLIKKVSGNKTGLGMSFYMLAGELARAIGPIIIVSAVSWWGLENTYRLIPAGIIASVILFFRLRKLKDFDFKKPSSSVNLKQTLKELKGFFIVLTGYSFTRGLMRGLLITFLPVYLTSKGESLWVAAYSLSILEFAGAAGSLVAGGVSDKIGRRNTLVSIAVVTPFLMLFYNQTEGLLNIFMLMLIGFFIFGSGPVLLALVQEKNSERPSFTNGVYMTINFALGAIAALLVGWLSDYIGLAQTFQLAPLFAALAIPFAFLFKDAKPKLSE